MKILRLMGLSILCCCIQACIEGDEDVWIEADGSAKIRATYRVPAMLLSAKDAEEFKQSVESGIGENPNLRLITNRVDQEKGQRIIRLEIETDNIAELKSLGVDEGSDVAQTKSGKMLNAILGTIHIYPTLAEANKYAAGVWKKSNSPEGLLKWVEKFHSWRR